MSSLSVCRVALQARVNGTKIIMEQRPANVKTLKSLKATVKNKEAGKIAHRGLCGIFKHLPSQFFG